LTFSVYKNILKLLKTSGIIYMDKIVCDLCTAKNCRKGKDCYGVKDASLAEYSRPEIKKITDAASELIDNGRAGTLNRLEEIIEYCNSRGYKRIGLAYCIAFDSIGRELSARLRGEWFETFPVICTTGGVLEREIDTSKTKDTVSCNPVGQALVLKNQNVDFIIELGLCLGHDVIFHKELDVPFTVLIVKDRVYNHNPARALVQYKDKSEQFIDSLDDNYNMRAPQWVIDEKKNSAVHIIDLRSESSFSKEHISGSINILLKDLPGRYRELQLPKDETIICLCNGSVQSAYAIMFLYGEGFRKVYNLSGGFARWVKDGGDVIRD
jgi:uncharacterized metal-binding protein/rhodanese-related sulfurtransferase